MIDFVHYYLDTLENRIQAMAKILIAEDRPEALTLMKFILKRFEMYGVEIYTTSNGHEACEVAETIQPDIALLDIMMPGMDGLQVCDFIKKSPHLAHAYVIMVTAKTQQSSRLQAAVAGADEYMPKPYDAKQLVERVCGALNIHL